MELKEIGCPILARCSRGWDSMSAISPGVLSRSRFFHSPILFRESNPAALIASLFAKGKIKNGVPHILESHPRERRARMGHPLHGSTRQKIGRASCREREERRGGEGRVTEKRE